MNLIQSYFSLLSLQKLNQKPQLHRVDGVGEEVLFLQYGAETRRKKAWSLATNSFLLVVDRCSCSHMVEIGSSVLGDFADIRSFIWVVCIISSGWCSFSQSFLHCQKTSLEEQTCLPLATLTITYISQHLLCVGHFFTSLSGSPCICRSCPFLTPYVPPCEANSQKSCRPKIGKQLS